MVISMFEAWSNHKTLIVRSGDDMTDVQYKLTVRKATGTDIGTTCFVPGSRDDFGDVRFSMNGKVIPFFIDVITGTTATFWLKASFRKGENFLQVHWGKAILTCSNGLDVFEFYDTFTSLEKWRTFGDDGNSVTIIENNLTLPLTADGYRCSGVTSRRTFSVLDDFTIEAVVKHSTFTNEDCMVSVGFTNGALNAHPSGKCKTLNFGVALKGIQGDGGYSYNYKSTGYYQAAVDDLDTPHDDIWTFLRLTTNHSSNTGTIYINVNPNYPAGGGYTYTKTSPTIAGGLPADPYYLFIQRQDYNGRTGNVYAEYVRVRRELSGALFIVGSTTQTFNQILIKRGKSMEGVLLQPGELAFDATHDDVRIGTAADQPFEQATQVSSSAVDYGDLDV